MDAKMADRRLNEIQRAARDNHDSHYERSLCRAALSSVRAAYLMGQDGKAYISQDTWAEIELALSMLSAPQRCSPTTDELSDKIGSRRWVLVKAKRVDRDTSRYVGCNDYELQINHREYAEAEMAALASRVGRQRGFVEARVAPYSSQKRR
jgi:hypothetical protein